MLKEIINFIISLIGVIIIWYFLGFWLIPTMIDSYEKYECTKWEQESGEYNNYYITSWQLAQCSHYNIKINAIVK